ncbi:MAG: gamma-glutamyl-gamma-aminobutyrate hydrolase family protein [Chitinophagales bacterium]|nr:gamma-glutamyl-gamma-aminobutyrate hydrolase family protein [Chitinophagales bacterium]MDW8419646.1 gamma-glutamyl-gamma-aminobutyrate hydrolase family protein [Chitinophagales bacterium]
MKIGLTFTESRWENYPAWIKGTDSDIEIVELHWEKHHKEEVWELIDDCQGIVLTGGVDIHPRFYDNPRTNYPNGDGRFNELRDEFEMHVFETALNLQLPVLAICRGHQLVNVALGGQLMQDLEEGGNKDHRRHGDTDGEHEINVVQHSLLAGIIGSTTARINSAHHQGISVLADELAASAYSPDFVIEATEWKDKTDKPWLLTVQWHPERMIDKHTNPASYRIREEFLNEARKR